jgi:hypothetical protein
MDVNGKLYASAALTQGKHTCTHRVEVWMGPGNQLDAWKKKRYLAFGRKRASGQQNIVNTKREEYDFNTVSLSLHLNQQYSLLTSKVGGILVHAAADLRDMLVYFGWIVRRD